MFHDGAQGMLALRRQGWRTIAQDESSSVVWGMPRAAIELGAADEVLHVDRIAEGIARLVREPGHAAGPASAPSRIAAAPAEPAVPCDVRRYAGGGRGFTIQGPRFRIQDSRSKSPERRSRASPGASRMSTEPVLTRAQGHGPA